jgi:phage terminase large subunit-like protein
MDDKYADLIRTSKNYKEDRERKFKSSSRDRLLTISSKKIKTTMIGALATIEKNFGFLWGEESNTLTAEQKHMKELFDQVRSEILDKGNAQVRNLEAEFQYYDITWLRYNMSLPVKTLDSHKEENKDG